MPKVTEEHRLAKHDEILDAALRAFHRKGFQSTSMAEIIAESGMSAGAIYGYFGSKTDIVRSVATAIISARVEDLENLGALEQMPDPGEVVQDLINSFLTAAGWPSILVQVWGEAIIDPPLREVVNEIFHRVRLGFEVYLARWQQQAHGLSEAEAHRVAKDQAPLFISAVHGFVVQDSLFNGFDREAYLERALSYLPR
jgi:AcrR family transcriptional regulator